MADSPWYRFYWGGRGRLTTHVRGKRESGWNKDPGGPTDPDIIGWSRLAVLRRRDGWKVFQLCGFRCAGWWMNRSTRRRSNFSFGAASKESGVDRETRQRPPWFPENGEQPALHHVSLANSSSVPSTIDPSLEKDIRNARFFATN